MKIFATSIFLVLMSITSAFAQDVKTQDVIVKTVNFKSDKGKVFIGLYNSETSFMKDDYRSSISEITNKECTVTFKNLPAGTYAITLFHDENDNGKMDTNMFGIPKEDYGCSNNAKGFMGPPKWNDTKFEIKNESITQLIKI